MNKYKILTLNGGGIRGCVSARLLQRLNEAYPFIDNTDLFAGVSTGGLISIALAYGFSPESVKDIYLNEGKNIFRDCLLDDLKDLFGLAGADYDISNLESVLKNIFGKKRISDLDKKVLVTAFDLDNENRDASKRSWAPLLITNLKGVHNEEDFYLYQAGCATSAAPSYFPSYNGLVDGGLVNRNCSMAALCMVLSQKGEGPKRNKEEVLLLNIGTGLSLRYLEGKEHDYGLLDWQNKIIAAMMDGDDFEADRQCSDILGENYFRLSPVFPSGVNIDMDAVDKLNYLIEFADKVDIGPALQWLRENWK